MDTKTFIEEHGGATKLAKLLKFGKGGAQRVHNWIARGRIPAQVRLDHPKIFSAKGKKREPS
ncbi:MAG: hypothetical protein PHP57_13895 [Sideroxydans sp.]|nr:hypothetical protein [Sideroxydans sp.]